MNKNSISTQEMIRKEKENLQRSRINIKQTNKIKMSQHINLIVRKWIKSVKVKTDYLLRT